MQIAKYSFGTGDRFGLSGKAQLAAIQLAAEKGLQLDIVWNKSHREHTIVGTDQRAVRQEADSAIRSQNWKGGYFVDADHIGLDNVDLFLDSSDFFTLDVADFIGGQADPQRISVFIKKHPELIGKLHIPAIEEPLLVDQKLLESIVATYLPAIHQAGKIYRHILANKGEGNFIVEVSMDETETPQTPLELLVILAGLADEQVPLQTIAPKFSGRFNKGVDYVGDVKRFTREFDQDLAIVSHAVQLYGLDPALKLSIHSGSDKFSIYGPIRALLKKHNAGIHVKTAGTSWLEELIGLAEAEGEALEIVKEIYKAAYSRYEELCAPYSTVIDIEYTALPTPEKFASWSGERIASMLRHDQSCGHYDLNLRQLLHVAYKIAAEMGPPYLTALTNNSDIIARNVTENLYTRHIVPLFLAQD